MTKKKAVIVEEEIVNTSEAPTKPAVPTVEDVGDNPHVPEEYVPPEIVDEPAVEQKIELYGVHVIDLTDKENVIVHGGPVRANLGKMTLKAVKAWLEERSWETE